MSLVESGYEPTLTRSIGTTDTTVFVSSLPGTTTTGYLMLDPGNSKAELIKFTGTSASPVSLTGVTRNLSFTSATEATTGTAYAHTAGAKAKMTDVHLLFNQKLLDGSVANSAALPSTNNWDNRMLLTEDDNILHIWDSTASSWSNLAAPASAGDASSSVKGIAKLTADPTTATNPIAIGATGANTVNESNFTLTLTQTKTSGSVLTVQRNLTSTSTDSSVLQFLNQHASDDQDILLFTNTATSNSLTIDQNGAVGTTRSTDGALFIENTGNTGIGFGVYSNAAAAGASAPLVAFTADESTFDQSVLSVVQDGTREAGVFSHSGALDAGFAAVEVNDNSIAHTTGQSLFHVNVASATTSIPAQFITNAGTGNALTIDQNGNVGIDSTTDGALFIENTGNTGIGLGVYSNIGATSDGSLVAFHADNSAFDQSLFALINDGTGNSINIVNNGNGDAQKIVNAGTGNGLTIDQNGNVGTDALTDGALFIENTGNTGIGLGIYSNIGATAEAPLVNIRVDNVAFDHSTLIIQQDGTKEVGLFIHNGVLDAGYAALEVNDNSVAHTTGQSLLHINIVSTTTSIPAQFITNAGTGNAITIDQNGNVGTDTSLDGALFIENTGNTGIGLGVYSNLGATTAAPLVTMHVDNSAFNQPLLNLKNDGASSAINISNTGDGGVFVAQSIGITSQTAIICNANASTSGKILDCALASASSTGTVALFDTAGTGFGIQLVVDNATSPAAFIDFDGVSEASSAKNVSTWTAGATLQGYIKVNIQGTDRWMPYYTAPTS